MVKKILSCDWGTSSFRLRLINVADKSVLAETTAGDGIAVVHHNWLQSDRVKNERIGFYTDILLSQIEKLDNHYLAGIPMIISGMASSSIGITELPYGDIPFRMNSTRLNVQRIVPGGKYPHEILLVSGLKAKDDVMRGEETKLLGCEISEEGEQLIIFPGTHSKHVLVKGNLLVDFKTFMTGEVFDLLSNKSILSGSVKINEWLTHQNIFEKGLLEGAENNLLNAIFHVRTSHLFKSLNPEENYHFLSGILIGSELKRIAGTKIKILLVCGQPLYERYWRGLQLLCGKENLQYQDADKSLIAGHCKLATQFL